MPYRFAVCLSPCCALLLAACSTVPEPNLIEISPADSVSRRQALEIAEAYRTHVWRPTAANVMHGKDAKGVEVHTPDVSLPATVTTRPGWWRPGEVAIGFPYMWGGFDTPASFDQKIADGRAAGDVYTEAKRAALDDAVSESACGVDCSGYVSRCWRLDRSYSTRELPLLCEALPSYDGLKPGDILNLSNVHALLFVRFVDADRTRFVAYETGSPPTWKVLRHEISVAFVQGLGYLPYRYRGMRD